MKYICYAFLIVLGMLTAGCIVKSKRSGCENEALVEKAKERVLASTLELSSNEREMVKSQRPKIQIYRLAADYVDYHFEWISMGIRIVVRGRGRLSELEGAEVEKIRVNEFE